MKKFYFFIEINNNYYTFTEDGKYLYLIYDHFPTDDEKIKGYSSNWTSDSCKSYNEFVLKNNNYHTFFFYRDEFTDKFTCLELDDSVNIYFYNLNSGIKNIFII